MKKRGLLTTLIAFVIAFMLPFVSVAAEVSTAEELQNAFYSFNNSEDTELVIVLTANIEDAAWLEVLEGKTYYINGNEYTLAEVTICGAGDVQIDADMVGSEDSYESAVLNVYNNSEGSLSVEVTGDIIAGEAQDGANIVGENIYAEITGDITAGDSDDYGVDAGDGLLVQGENIEVLVDGNVTGGNAEGEYSRGGDGVIVIDGYNSPNSLTEEAEDAETETATGVKVTVTGDITSGDSAKGTAGDGLYVGEEDFDTPESEYYPMDQPEVNVGGNVTGGNSSSVDENGGAGIYMDSSAKVTVEGNVTGGNASGAEAYAGNGVYVVLRVKQEPYGGRSWENGEVFIKGIVDGGYAADGERAAAIYLDGSMADLVDKMDDYYLSEGEQTAYIEERLEYLKEYDAEKYLALGVLSDVVEYVDEYIRNEADLDNSKEDAREYQYKLMEKACEFINADLETLMEDPDGQELFWNSLMALSQEEQIELSKQLVALYNEMIVEISVSAEMKNNAMPDISVWGFGTNSENIQTDDTLALVEEILNEDVNYLIKVADVENGSVAVATKARVANAEGELTAKAGETVIVTPTPAEGYKMGKVFVSGTEITPIDGVYSFVVPEDGQVIVSAEFEEIVIEPEEEEESKDEQKEETKPVVKEAAESVVPKTNDVNSSNTYAVLMLVSLVCVLVTCKKLKKG